MPQLSDIPPRGLVENLKFRLKMLQWGSRNRDNARALWSACKRDIVFYTNTFVYTFSPKDFPEQPVRPFILWEFQEEALRKMVKLGGKNDMLIEKSRDMGASWLVILVAEWFWHFYDNRPILLFSRNADLVEKTDNPDSMFWKFDFIHQYQPGWLKPPGLGSPPISTMMHRYNLDTDSVVDGGSTTEDVSRGGRRFMIVLDEFASVVQGTEILASSGDATNCRIFNSTPKGPQGAFYELRERGQCEIIRFHWSDHPLKRVGLYRCINDRMEYIDEEYWTPERINEYNFILDGKLRSVPYDAREKRAASPIEMAQEWDIDYVGSAELAFPADLISKLVRRDCHPPFLRGRMEFDKDSLLVTEFVEEPTGPWRLWIHPSPRFDMPSMYPYVIGCDIGEGTGSSSSCLTVLQITGTDENRRAERVAEYVSNTTAIHEFTAIAAAAGYWFTGPDEQPALLNWEANGPGMAFGKRLIHALRYPRPWYRRDDATLSMRPSADKLGWFNTGESRSSALRNYRVGLETGGFVNHCQEALRECLEYRVDNRDRIIHKGTKKSAARNQLYGLTTHSDRVIADTTAYLACGVAGSAQPKEEEQKPAYGSFKWRRERHMVERDARMTKRRKLQRVHRR